MVRIPTSRDSGWVSKGKRQRSKGGKDFYCLLFTFDFAARCDGAVLDLAFGYCKRRRAEFDRIGVVLVNAVKEQQAQIDAQQKQVDALIKTGVVLQHKLAEQQQLIKSQQTRIEALKVVVCNTKRSARICKE